jgi:hypothetical protein
VDALKIENFSSANRGSAFPTFEHLSPSDCAHLRSEIANRIGLDPQTKPLRLLETLHAQAKPLTSVDEAGFELRAVISVAGFNGCSDVYVNWYRFDHIDRIALLDLSKYFSDIWYPSSDDIEIFDGSLDWFVLITHDGLVSVLDVSRR